MSDDAYIKVTTVGASASPIQEQFDQLTAERDALKAEAETLRKGVGDEAGYHALVAEVRSLRADNERLRAELRLAQPFHRDAIKERERERTQLTGLREAAEELAYEALCVAEPSELLVSKARAVLAKLKP